MYIFRNQNPEIGRILMNIINSFVRCGKMHIIYKCFVFLYSIEIQTHINNNEFIYFKILNMEFEEMIKSLKNLINNLNFDIYLLP